MMELEGPSTLIGSNKDVKVSNVNVKVELLNTPLFKSLFLEILCADLL